MAAVFNDLLVEASWVEKIVVSDIERLAHPEMDFVPVFGDGGQKHVAVAEDFFFFMNEFIDNIGDVFAFLEHDDWFRIFLAVVVSHAVIFSFFVFKNEAWTTEPHRWRSQHKIPLRLLEHLSSLLLL